MTMGLLKHVAVSVFGAFVILSVTGCEGTSSTAPRTLLTSVSVDTFEQLVLKNEKPVLLDFWAPWCGPCKQLMPTLEEMAAKYEGKLVIVKANTDEEKELAQEYKVSGIPRLIYFKNGKVVISEGERSRAGIEKEIEAVIKL